MAEKISNPEAPVAAGVPVDNPQITEAIKNMAKNGVPKERAMKLSGMPMEVVDKNYREMGKS